MERLSPFLHEHGDVLEAGDPAQKDAFRIFFKGMIFFCKKGLHFFGGYAIIPTFRIPARWSSG